MVFLKPIYDVILSFFSGLFTNIIFKGSNRKEQKIKIVKNDNSIIENNEMKTNVLIKKNKDSTIKNNKFIS